jgi:hypothetical protein
MDAIVQTVSELAGAAHTKRRQSTRAPKGVETTKALVGGCELSARCRTLVGI